MSNKLAPYADGIPIVQSTADRTALFPAPATDQRVYNKETRSVERWDGAAWLDDNTIAQDFVPAADATYSLGSALLRWKNLYLSGTAAIGGLLTAAGATLSSHLLAATDNLYDIGALAATRFRNLYLAGAIAAASITVTGTATANLFSGSGASLTALNATNLASGTVPDARFPATLPVASGVNLTALNASNLASGTVASARLTGLYTGITGLGTQASHLLFTDNTYDIGASGATRPRNLYVAGNGTFGGTLGVTGAVSVGPLTTTGASAIFNIDPRDGSGTTFSIYNPTGDDLRFVGSGNMLILTDASATFSGSIILPNAVDFKGKDTGGTARSLLNIDAANNVNVGRSATTAALNLFSGGAGIAFYSAAVAVLGSISDGGAWSTNGGTLASGPITVSGSSPDIDLQRSSSSTQAYGHLRWKTNQGTERYSVTVNEYIGEGVEINAALANVAFFAATGTQFQKGIALSGSTIPSHGVQFGASAPGVLANGQMWYDGTDFKVRTGGATKTITVV